MGLTDLSEAVPPASHTPDMPEAEQSGGATGFRTLLDLIVAPGSARLARVAKSMLQSFRRQVPRGQLRVVLNAGAALSHMHAELYLGRGTLTRLSSPPAGQTPPHESGFSLNVELHPERCFSF